MMDHHHPEQPLVAAAIEQLGKPREGLFRVVMIHHPPTSRAARYLKRLVDGAALRAVLASHGAELVIHGHDHVHSLVYFAGPQRRVPVLGVPSASQTPRGAQAPGVAKSWRADLHPTPMQSPSSSGWL